MEIEGALRLKRPSNRERLNLLRTYENLTLMVWSRIDGFDRDVIQFIQ